MMHQNNIGQFTQFVVFAKYLSYYYGMFFYISKLLTRKFSSF